MINHIENCQTLTLRGDYLKIGRNNTTTALLLDLLEGHRKIDPTRHKFTVEELFIGLMGITTRDNIIEAMKLLMRINLVLGIKVHEIYHINLNVELINSELAELNQVAA